MPCPNCDQPLPDPPPTFCPACGQETRVRPPTLGEFLQQFGGAYLSTEGALWRTLKLLLLKPGELTRQYLAGRRKHYVLPLRLYLTVSVIVLLALRVVAGLTLQIDPERDIKIDEKPVNVSIHLGWGSAGLKDGVFFCENLPRSVCQRLERRLDFDPKRLAVEVAALGERALAALGPAMFLLLPVFAGGLALVYRSRRLRATEHLVFALHVHAFWFLVLGLTLLPLGGVEGFAWLAVPVYTLLAMRRVYGGRWWPRLLRAGVVTLLYGAALVFTMIFVGLWALLA